MKVLLIGDANRITGAIADKLNKEGHRVFALMSSKRTHYRHVYEKYIFEYDNTCMKDVFESIMPDLTIFAGAYDDSFDWNGLEDAQVAYTAALGNMLAAYSRLGRGRFVYLSSEEVYRADMTQASQENAAVIKARSVRQGETTCANYRIATGMDIIVARAENICFVPKNAQEVRDVCSRACVEMLEDGQIHCPGTDVSLLALPDAVWFLYNIFTAEKCRYPVYTVTTNSHISYSDMIDMINAAFGRRVPVVYDDSENVIWVEELEVHDYAEEFTFAIFSGTKECAEAVIKAVNKNPGRYITKKAEQLSRSQQIAASLKSILKTFVPFIENMICFIPFFMINNRAVGSQFFGKLDSYLLYVLLFAIIYGQQQATFSAILAVAGYCFRQMYTKSGLEVIVDYNTYVWIAQLVILGLAVGYLRDRLVVLKRDKDDEIEYLKHRLRDIEEINRTNVKLKNEMERQIVNQSDSMGKIYEITSSLDKYEPEEVLFYAAEVVSRLMESRDVAIYTVSNENFARLISFTSKTARQLGNSIEFRSYKNMYEDFAADRVFVNRRLEEGLPMMALAIRSEGVMKLIVMLWDIPFERMNLSMANRLKIIGSLTQNSVVRADRYMSILAGQRYISGTHILEKDAFTSLAGAFVNARRRGLAECSFIKVDAGDGGIAKAGESLERIIRNTDYMGDAGDGCLYIMLASTDADGMRYVEHRIAEAGYQYEIPEEMGA
jgi:nucleoside-diphosphate-sugar epimerase